MQRQGISTKVSLFAIPVLCSRSPLCSSVSSVVEVLLLVLTFNFGIFGNLSRRAADYGDFGTVSSVTNQGRAVLSAKQ